MFDGRHASVVGELRARIAHLEQGGRVRPVAGFRLGVPEIESHLPNGGLARGALHKVIGGRQTSPTARRRRCSLRR